jgi:hypothetical protein
LGSPAASEDTLGASQPRLEILEPRVLLSADGLVLELAAQQVAAVGVAEQHVDLVQVATPAAVNAQGVPYDQDFTDGLPTVDQGWEYYSSNQGRIQVLSNRLWMDDSGGGDPYSLNEAILHLNLTGKRGVQLMLNHTSLSDDVHSLPAGFTGHYNGDGIALSVDGIHWVTITPLTESFEDRPFALDGLLDQARTAAGSTDVSDVRIKFQQYDNYPAPDDGRQFDSIRVTAGATPQTTPYIQDFPVLPGAAQGWEYYSTGQGRIQATSEGRLRMDDFGGGDPYSLNEAILHVNLEGHHDIQLVLDHTNLADDNTPLPASFAGHYNGDGIALSLDGIHWVTVANLTDSFTGGIFTLDGPHGILWQAQNAADDGDMTDVRIKFQQYDNYPAPDDGREFDNIRILVGIATQAIPYAQNFSAALPTGAQGWEYYSTGQGRIQVAGDRLRMDDFGPGDP